MKANSREKKEYRKDKRRLRHMKYGIAGQMIQRFIWYIVIYTIVMAALFGIIYFWGTRTVWHGDEPLYGVLTTVRDQWHFFFMLVLFVGCMLIAGVQFFHFATLLEQMTSAVSDLSTQRVRYITLPGRLAQVETELNQILQRMQQDQLVAKEAEQRKNDMIVYMAHDLKTPLTSVIGYLTLLQDEKAISQEVREKYIAIALRKSERLEDLTNEFFEMTKYNFSNTVLSMSKVDLSMMLEQILYEFIPIFKEKGITAKTEIAPGLKISCDVDKMERVFDNLIKNAYNYCYENTEIEVSMVGEKEGVRLVMKNKGRTIPPEKLDHLFEQFFRMDSSRSSKTGGSGLGLAIAKEIITLHHGTIAAESADETITFSIYLPQ